MYKEKKGSLNGIASVRKNASADKRFERKAAKNGKPFFVLKTGNHQIIGQSELYESEKARDNGIASVKMNAPGAKLDDLSA
jgi:uncharacterized protein YegP (UPF0339 family)